MLGVYMAYVPRNSILIMPKTFKQIVVLILLFTILFWGGAALLREYTLNQTQGKCEAMFTCVCQNIGNGICDGIHYHNGFYIHK